MAGKDLRMSKQLIGGGEMIALKGTSEVEDLGTILVGLKGRRHFARIRSNT